MKPTGATKEATSFTSEIVMGRYKISQGAVQIATADNAAAAWMITTALNERERLREALRVARTCLVTVGPDKTERTSWLGVVTQIDAALNEVEG